MLATPVILKEDNISHSMNFVNLMKWVCEKNRRIIIAVEEGGLGSIGIPSNLFYFFAFIDVEEHKNIYLVSYTVFFLCLGAFVDLAYRNWTLKCH